MHRLELLSVCKKPHEIYQKTFKNCLPGCRGEEQIRSSDDTTVYISNFANFAMKLEELEVEEFRKTPFPDTIREVSFDMLFYSNYANKSWCVWLLSLFEELKLVRVYAVDYHNETREVLVFLHQTSLEVIFRTTAWWAEITK